MWNIVLNRLIGHVRLSKGQAQAMLDRPSSGLAKPSLALATSKVCYFASANGIQQKNL
jgi:hypothetical protein